MEKSHVLNHDNNSYGTEGNHPMSSPWSENRDLYYYKSSNRIKGLSDNQQDDKSTSMFQKFRVQRYEDERMTAQPFSSFDYDKRRNANLNHRSAELSKGIKVCASCHTSNSPEWRRGPDGHKT